MNEVWKPIKNYEELYEVSNLGNVRSFKYNRIIVLKPHYTNKKYFAVGLYKKSKIKTFQVHRLVAEAFIPNPENKPQVNHINGIKTDNRVENLEWCTNQENVIHAFKTGLEIVKRGGEHHSSKKVNQYDLNGNFIKRWDCITDIQRKLNINRHCVINCCKKKQYTAGGYKWEYV